jgi:hypothetical protein
MPEATQEAEFYPRQVLFSELDGLSPEDCKFCWILQEA